MNSSDLEVDLTSEHGKAIIEGKTPVPFKTFVMLILQRKVTSLFQKWGENKVIVESELLTSLASAPDDGQDNKQHLVLVTLGVGVLFGVLAFSVIQILLLAMQVQMGMRELLLIAGAIVAVGLLTTLLLRIKKRNRGEKVVEALEKVAALLSKK